MMFEITCAEMLSIMDMETEASFSVTLFVVDQTLLSQIVSKNLWPSQVSMPVENITRLLSIHVAFE